MGHEVEGTRPKKAWREIVEKDCQAHGLNREEEADKGRLMTAIGVSG